MCSLAAKCVEVIVENFEKVPQHEGVPLKYLKEITSKLKLDLEPSLAARFIFDDHYWQKRCESKNIKSTTALGLSWKQIFFEHTLQERIEHQAEISNDFLIAVQDYIFRVRARQLKGHPDIDFICQKLPNLNELDLTYGALGIGMRYDRLLFGIKISDAVSIAKTITNSSSLTKLALTSNLIDDDLIRILIPGLIKSTSLTFVDLSHNKITDHGARLLAKALNHQNSLLSTLNLCDNKIRAEGGRSIGQTFSSSSLTSLNMRLNRLGDQGGMALLEGLRLHNSNLTDLNIAANSLAKYSAQAAAHFLEAPSCILRALNLSCNDLQDEDLFLLKDAVCLSNRTITSLDLRMNTKLSLKKTTSKTDDSSTTAADAAYRALLSALKRNELLYLSSSSS